MKPAAQRMSSLSPHFFAALNARLSALKAAGRDIIRLDEGSPDLPPAPFIIQALSTSASMPDHHGYQPHRGPQGLCEAWAESYRRNYQVDIDPATEVLPLLGSKEGIFHIALAYVEAGDYILVPDPGYVTYTRGALMAGGLIYTLPLLPDHGYFPDFRSIPIEVSKRAKILWLNYPNNPTTATPTRAFFTEAVEFARQFDLLLCHDAAYNQIVFEEMEIHSILQIPGAKDVAVEFATLSKSHNMAGWRSAALLGNAEVIRNLYVLKTNADSSHFLPIMEASIAALSGDQGWTKSRNEVYRQRRDVLVNGLRAMGFSVDNPKASLYVWCPIPKGWTSVDYTTTLLEQTGVSVTPGTVFGEHGEGFIRISITAPVERIEQAVDRIAQWVRQ
jgi:LL-diaminopimelate aminotransferase